jgi:hypothetical protein
MRILFDQGVPLPLKRWLTSHEVETARQRGWSEFLNGDLLVLMTANWPTMEPFASEIAAAVDRIGQRQYMEWFPS